MKRKSTGGVLRGAHGFFHYNSADAKGFQHQCRFELKWRKIHMALPKNVEKEKENDKVFFFSPRIIQSLLTC